MSENKQAMKKNISQAFKKNLFTPLLCAAIGFTLLNTSGFAQTAAPALPPGVQDVLKLSQAGLGEDVILSQVKTAGATYQLNADQIIYLSKAGVSQNVIKALISGNNAGAPAAVVPAPVIPAPATAPAPSATIPPPPSAPPVATAPSAPPDPSMVPAGGVSYDSFHDQLAPYGTWMQVPGYGWCWR